MARVAQQRQFKPVVAPVRPSAERLGAWPSLGRAAEILSIPASTLSRAVDAKGITKHEYGRRDKKLAPDAVLELALVYAVDVNEVAERLMLYAEASGAGARFVDGVERTAGAWLAGRARQASAQSGDLDAVVAAVRELVAPELAEAILARAGIMG